MDSSFQFYQFWFLIYDENISTGVTAVIFVAAISEYDQKLFEDASTNRMVRTLHPLFLYSFILQFWLSLSSFSVLLSYIFYYSSFTSVFILHLYFYSYFIFMF